MSDMITISGDELSNLEQRVKKLAMEKSYLQLLIHMMGKLSSVSGLKNMIESLLQVILNNIGGSNLILYYVLDRDIYYVDVFGKKMKLSVIEDLTVKKVFETCESIEFEHDFSDTKMMTPEFTKASTWVFPLLVGHDLIGVLKMEGMHIGTRELHLQLPTFFSYAAHILNNEISGYTKLKKAYEQLSVANEELSNDVAERKNMEAALRESEERYRSVVEDQTEVISRFLSDGTFTFVNEVFCRFFGKTGRDLLGRKWQPQAVPEDVPLIEEQLRSLSPSNPVAVIENRIYSGSGQLRWMQFANRGLFDNEGRLVEIQSVGRDITDRKRAEEERLEMERKLLHKRKLESLGVLAGGIAHDFNNLLSVILGNLDLALQALPSVSPVREDIEQAVQASQRAVDLVRQMLAYLGKGLFVLKEIDLNNVVCETAALFGTTAARNVALNITTTPDLPLIKADERQIRQVVMNLINNASEAIGTNPGAITLGTGLLECDDAYLSRSRVEEKPQAGRFVYVEVSDTGCGMDEDTQQRLFEPFFTTKFIGRGLGLSAVLGIVREHKGAIFLESDVERGSTFRILFPVSEEVREQTHEIREAATQLEAPAALTGTVLVVDDEDQVRDFCMAAVEFLGFPVIGASGGIEALRIFRKHANEIALVILDLTMPNIDGIKTFHELRHIRSDVRVILSSGFSEKYASGQFIGDKPASFVQKPFRIQDLKAKIAQVMK
jgi:two-component system cell cycle sensor histidine kinase/response regulator CckA